MVEFMHGRHVQIKGDLRGYHPMWCEVPGRLYKTPIMGTDASFVEDWPYIIFFDNHEDGHDYLHIEVGHLSDLEDVPAENAVTTEPEDDILDRSYIYVETEEHLEQFPVTLFVFTVNGDRSLSIRLRHKGDSEGDLYAFFPAGKYNYVTIGSEK